MKEQVALAHHIKPHGLPYILSTDVSISPVQQEEHTTKSKQQAEITKHWVKKLDKAC